MKKLTKAQKERLRRIRQACDRDREGYCSAYDAGYPAWPMVAALKDAALIEIVQSDYGRWPVNPAKGYRITAAGRAVDGGARI